ncbi:MAG: COG1361 S-layer family protein [archaeon]|nr:COG1361 S-layer family protein [archaeon]
MRKFLIAFAVLFLAANVAAADLVIDSVSYNPAPAIPGEYFDLFIQLKNNSKYLAEDVEFTLDLSGGNERNSDYPFSLGTGTNNKNVVPSIQARKNALLEYKVRVDPTALDGTYTIVFRFKESDALKEYNYTINVLSRQPDIKVVNASHVAVAPGQIAELELTLRNVGTGSARDILAGIEEDRTVTTTGVVVEREFSAIGASFDYVKGIEPGKETTAVISLAVNPDAEQKTYTVPVAIKYKDANSNEYTDTSYIGLQVVQEPEIDAVVSEITPGVMPGGTSEVTVDLFNVGVGTAKYVVVEASTTSGKINQEKVFIGTLEADDFDSFKIDVRFNADIDTSMDQPLNLVLTYKNQYGVQKQVERTVKLDGFSAAGAQAVGADPIGMVIGFIALLLQLLGLFIAGKWGYKKFVKKA